jgi:hypothetical protein
MVLRSGRAARCGTNVSGSRGDGPSHRLPLRHRPSGCRKVKSDWDAWNARALAEEPIVRLMLD